VHLHAVTGPAQVGYAPELVANLLAADLDCLHLHGIWMYPSQAGARWAQRTGRPYLISPHGMLEPWITARGRWKKALARAGYERASWRAASAFHALTASEAEDIRRETGRADIIIIANAGPPVALPDPAVRAPHVVYIGRIHPKKNLLALVVAWRQVQGQLAKPEGSRMTIAGWGEADDIAALQKAIGEGGGGEPEDSIHFAGPVFGEAKQALLASARFVILPSLSEGLPMAILEGWAAGAPSIMTPACHLPEGFAAGAALACGTDAASIAQALTEALRLDEPGWRTMSSAAQTLAAGPFAAETVAARWAEAYRALIARAPAKEEFA
jgi:glycosyltransferase involved in cell wall biosynthesis